eukprot:838984-Prorocentrum_minimum.AAC.1
MSSGLGDMITNLRKELDECRAELHMLRAGKSREKGTTVSNPKKRAQTGTNGQATFHNMVTIRDHPIMPRGCHGLGGTVTILTRVVIYLIGRFILTGAPNVQLAAARLRAGSLGLAGRLGTTS